MHRTMNVVPFRASETFEQHGIDWTTVRLLAGS
jgi:hypothetical protein